MADDWQGYLKFSFCVPLPGSFERLWLVEVESELHPKWLVLPVLWKPHRGNINIGVAGKQVL